MKVSKFAPIFAPKNKGLNIDILKKKNFPEDNFVNGTLNVKINLNILKHVESFLQSKHYYNAVEEAYKIVREKLREITGSEKASEAFSKKNIEKIFGRQPSDKTEGDFFDGVKFLHMAIQFLKNEKSHKPDQKIDKNEAIHYIVLASLAYDLIDN